MAASGGEVKVIITATTEGLVRGIASARDALNRAAPSIERFGKLMAGVVAAGIAVSLKEFAAADKAVRGLEQALRNQGVTSREVARDLVEYAGKLQMVSTKSDEAIIDAQKLLVTFGLTGEQLKATTKSALDLSAGLGIDLHAATLLLGKAAVGETSTLSRYGIVISENIPRAEKFAEALRQINSRFGGAALADAKSFSGQLVIAKNILSDISEVVGAELEEPVRKLIEKLISSKPTIEAFVRSVSDSLHEWVDDLKEVSEFFNKHWDKITRLATKGAAIGGVAGGIIGTALFGPVGGLGGALGGAAFGAHVGGVEAVLGGIAEGSPTRVRPPRRRPGPGGGGGEGPAGFPTGGFVGPIATPEQLKISERAVEEAKKVQKAWEDAFASISIKASTVADTVKAVFEGVTRSLADGFEAMFKGLADGALNIGEVLTNFAKSIRDMLFKIIAELMARILVTEIAIRLAKSVSAKKEIMEAAQVGAAWHVAQSSKIGPFGFLIGLATVGAVIAAISAFAQFAEGGIVTKPTLGLVGEAGPEAIIPLSKAKGMGLGGPVTVNINGLFLEADEAKWQKLVRRVIIPELDAHGLKTRSTRGTVF